MGRVNYDAVAEAATHLLKRHGDLKKVTIKGVRSELGGNGSDAAILKHLRAWKERLIAAREVVEADVEVWSGDRKLELESVQPVKASVEGDRLRVVIDVIPGDE